jgi:Ser/Thr protein kinase RdoA (MazF antagonist)
MIPTELIASSVAAEMLGRKVNYVKRIPFGTQNYVYEVSTSSRKYILRMTTPEWISTYESSVMLQQILLPLNIPLVPFLKYDLDGKYSVFPSVLMDKVPGTDLVNVYTSLSTSQKMFLADQVATIHAKTRLLPLGNMFGFARINEVPTYHTWSSFFIARCNWCLGELLESGSLSKEILDASLSVIDDSLSVFNEIEPVPFIWDMAEKNVLVSDGLLSGIVDVDNLCWGDPLYTVALAASACEKEEWDTIYTDRWLIHYPANRNTLIRYECYRLFWLMNFLRGTGRVRVNGNIEPDRKNHLVKLIIFSIKNFIIINKY